MKLECNLKSNISRIAQKIQEEGADGEYKITDMMRATITVDNPRQLKVIYETLETMYIDGLHIRMVKVKN